MSTASANGMFSAVKQTLVNIYTEPKIWLVLILSFLLTLLAGHYLLVLVFYTAPMSLLLILTEGLVVRI